MVQNAGEGKKDVRSVNAEQVCSHTELWIVVNRKKLVYLTSRITALGCIKHHCGKPHYIFIVLLRMKLVLLYMYT